MVVKTYRGLLADGGQDRIRLSTIKGKVGYKIIKFQVIQKEPGEEEIEITLKIYKTSQSSITNTIDFGDSDLLGAGYYTASAGIHYPTEMVVIFDNEIVNQDIFITCDDVSGNNLPGNYYLELEVIPLDDAGAEYTTIKDIRSNS